MEQQLLVLHLGSNMDNPSDYLNKALHLLEKEFGTPLKISSIYQTQAWGANDQPDFLNMAAVYKTELLPIIVLKKIKVIEKLIGRKPRKLWQMREIDIDIIFYGNKIIREKDLEIPHIMMYLRQFVLRPLDEIIPDFDHPGFHKTVHELLNECKDPLVVSLWKKN